MLSPDNTSQSNTLTTTIALLVEILKHFVNIALADTLLHDNSSLFPIISPEHISFDINRDAKNVKLPGTMWGIHYDIKTTIYSHIEHLYTDKIVRFTSTIPQVNNILLIYHVFIFLK